MATRGELVRLTAALAVSSGMALRGHRRRALSKSGSVAAFFVGIATFGSGLRFGFAMLMFYLAGTRATRYGQAHKKRIEDEYSHANGNRGAAQVLGSSLPGALLSIAYALRYRELLPLCSDDVPRTALQLAVLLFFAACAGDTFASEIGSVAAPSRPVLLIAPWRTVPAGVNGAVSLIGTAASALGGALVAIAFSVAAPAHAPFLPTLLVGVFGGFVGSALDSVLGALLQASWYDPREGKVLKETPMAGSEVALRAQLICGVDLLSGEAVNLWAAVLTCAFAPLFVRLYGAQGVPPWQ